MFSFAQSFRIGEYHYSGEGDFEAITAETSGIIFLQSGACRVTIDGNSRELTTGMVCFAVCRNYLNIACRHDVRSTLSFCLTDLNNAHPSVIPQLQELPALCRATDHLRKLFKLATRLNNTGDQLADNYRNILGDAIFSEYLSATGKHLILKEYPEPVLNLKQYIEKHFMEDCRFDLLARKFGFSSRYLESVFTKHVGATPTAYLWKIRREQALELLHNTGDSLGHIAEICGFKSVHHFSRHMKKYFTCSPSEIRQRYLYDNRGL